MTATPYVYFSYARADRPVVSQIAHELRASGVETWIDSENLQPGERWDETIKAALMGARALVVFLSRASIASKWFRAEFLVGDQLGKVIIPVLLETLDNSEVPAELASIQWLDVSNYPSGEVARRAAAEIARSLERTADRSIADRVDQDVNEELAQALTERARDSSEPSHDEAPPDSVFIVHGHDEDFLREVVDFVVGLGIRPIVMKEIGGASTSLLEKFLEFGNEARYAIVLLAGDDVGAGRFQYEELGVGPAALQYRARQNVILELGFFYGKLTWENVFVLERAPPKVFPNFERPSDLGGVVFDRYDASGRWRAELHARLSKAAFKMVAASEAVSAIASS